MLNKRAFLTIACTAAAFLAIPWSSLAEESAAAQANTAYSAAAVVPKLVINGVVFRPTPDIHEEQPIYLGGRDGQTLFVPIRSVLERLGYTVFWDESAQELDASKATQTIRHKIGTTLWRIQENTFHLDDVSVIHNGASWMPAEAVASSIGYRTAWNPLSQTLYLKPSLSASISDTLNGLNGPLTLNLSKSNGSPQQTGELLLNGSELWYEGDLAAAKPDGFGKLFEDGRLVYEGRFRSGQPDGSGTYYYPDGSRYIGQWTNGLQTGEGKLLSGSGAWIYSGDWINGIKQGFGRFYQSNSKLNYEGGVSQNKRNGRGVAFDASGVKTYDGDWRNGVRAGQGKAYDASGKIVYDGEWSDDVRSGSGRSFRVESLEWIYTDAQKREVKKNEPTTMITQETYYQGKLLTQGTTYAYTGEVLEDGTPNGKGTLRVKTGDRFSSVFGIKDAFRDAFEGEYQSGKQTGYGKLYDDQNRVIYQGELVDGKRNGLGNAFDKGMLVFEGYWEDDRETGIGRRYTYNTGMTAASLAGRSEATVEEGRYQDGRLAEKLGRYIYSGSFAGGMPNGYGTMTLMHDYVHNDGPKSLTRSNETGWIEYEGDFVNALREGKGKLFEKNKLVYEGDFVKGRREGIGKAYHLSSNTVYEGAFQSDLKNGYGRIYDSLRSSRTLLFEGSFRGDRKNGQGKLYYSDNGNLQYEGSFKDDLKDGFGKLYYADGITTYYEGEFRDDMTIEEFRMKNK
ncbi:stalk domain-containing protein [Paenibacillus allorhizosphaerae]|uniref:Copper amine oxidase-like N-terminal domain-containing protein n=1 Tax=Paenibacillus allorhizosphaerae TaxID=2849866 RepID=A0ABM8VMT5_9BACL|nr:stalk domain-containing protein [Paenibacillus allorhizosphaerae]CAG7650018.1 hypothetical protein PAECIP111802_04614 [Paenibacillus allorhizosphaerae]